MQGGSARLPAQQRVMFLPQSPVLAPGLTLAEQILYPFSSLSQARSLACDPDHLRWLLQAVGLDYLWERADGAWQAPQDWLQASSPSTLPRLLSAPTTEASDPTITTVLAAALLYAVALARGAPAHQRRPRACASAVPRSPGRADVRRRQEHAGFSVRDAPRCGNHHHQVSQLPHLAKQQPSPDPTVFGSGSIFFFTRRILTMTMWVLLVVCRSGHHQCWARKGPGGGAFHGAAAIWRRDRHLAPGGPCSNSLSVITALLAVTCVRQRNESERDRHLAPGGPCSNSLSVITALLAVTCVRQRNESEQIQEIINFATKRPKTIYFVATGGSNSSASAVDRGN